jgi:hypothetical protein
MIAYVETPSAAVELTERLAGLEGFLFVEVIGKELVVYVLRGSKTDWYGFGYKVVWCDSCPVLI